MENTPMQMQAPAVQMQSPAPTMQATMDPIIQGVTAISSGAAPIINGVNSVPSLNEVSSAQFPVENMASLFEADAGAGLEEADATCFSIPYLTVLQAQSPIVIDAQNRGDTSIRPGMIYNTVNGEVYDNIVFIQCHLKRTYQCWNTADRSFAGSYKPSDVETNKIPGVTKEGLNYVLHSPNGTFDLADTRLHYILYQDKSGAWVPAILALSKTQIKSSRKLVSIIKLIEFEIDDKTKKRVTPPSWAVKFNASVMQEKNNKGSWYSWNFSCTNEFVSDPKLYQMGRSLHRTIMEMDFDEIPAPTNETHDFQANGIQPNAYQAQSAQPNAAMAANYQAQGAQQQMPYDQAMAQYNQAQKQFFNQLNQMGNNNNQAQQAAISPYQSYVNAQNKDVPF